jgi:DNA-binding beta-propeller fold protein YncE
MIRITLVLLSITFSSACADGPSEPSVPGKTPTIHATLSFGLAPVTGNLVLEPAADASREGAWRYQIDVGEDGSREFSGLLDGISVFPYRFDEPGAHSIRVDLRAGDRVEVLREVVVVSDPQRLQEGGVVTVGDTLNEPGVLLGITVSHSGELIIAGKSFGQLVQVDSSSLSVKLEVDDQLPSTLEGISAAPDEDLLHTMSRLGHLGVFRLQDLQQVNAFALPEVARNYIQAISNRRAYVSGRQFALIDTSDGSVIRSLGVVNARHFAIDPTESRVAVSLAEVDLGSETQPAEILAVTASSFAEDWRLRLDDPREAPSGVAFSRDGQRVYVVSVVNGEQLWRFRVIDAANGALLRNMVLGRGCDSAAFCRGGPNSSAISADGGFVAFATGIGGIIVDRRTDLPVTQTPFGNTNYCCDVAANPVTNTFYFADLGFRIYSFRMAS